MAQENVRLACEPRTVAVVPGEPVRVEFTVQCRFGCPGPGSYSCRSVAGVACGREAARAADHGGLIIHKRVVIWQALEPGAVTMKAISVETQGRKRLFPEITITVSDPGP
jgi:hypothetical protein